MELQVQEHSKKPVSKQNSIEYVKAKQLIVDSILKNMRTLFQQEQEKSKKLTQEKQKNLKQADKTQELLLVSVTKLQQDVKQLISDNQNSKLDQKDKMAHEKLLQELQKCFVKFQDQKGIKIKYNDAVSGEVKHTTTFLNLISENYKQLAKAGCCGAGSVKKAIIENFRDFKLETVKFWINLANFESLQEGQIYVSPAFDEQSFQKQIQEIVDNYFPKDQEPVTIIKDKIVEKIVEVEKEVIVKEPVYINKSGPPDKLREAYELLTGLGRPQNIAEAIKIIKYEADQQTPNTHACNMLGKIYMEGKYADKNINEAYRYYKKSESFGNDEGIYRIGLFLEKGEAQNLELQTYKTRDAQSRAAVDYFKRAAKCQQPNIDALTDLGYIYENGLKSAESGQFIVQKDYNEAEKMYKEAIKFGSSRSMNNLGSFYLNTKKDNKIQEHKSSDNKRAMDYFEQSRQCFYPKASFNIGVCYEKGMGVRQDLEKAISYFEEAATRGDIDGKLFKVYYMLDQATNNDEEDQYFDCYNKLREILAIDDQKAEAYFYIGFLYEHGFGVELSEQMAIKHFKKAAEYGHSESINKLGDIYFSGFGVIKKDRLRAINYYEQAAKNNYAPAYINLGAIYEEGIQEQEPDFAKAYDMYKKASELGNAHALTCIGLMHELGRFVDQDEKKANDYFKLASDKGDQHARDILDSKQTAADVHQINVDIVNTLGVQGQYQNDEEIRFVDDQLFNRDQMVNFIAQDTRQPFNSVYQSKLQQSKMQSTYQRSKI